MFTLRSSATAASILAIGISAVWLSTERVTPGSSPSPVAAAAAAMTQNQSNPDCCGRTPALTEEDLQRQSAEKRAQAALLAKFDDWAERYARANADERAEMIPAGKAIAQERRVVMTKLIKEDPREAIEAADRLSPLARQALPSEVAEDVEKMVSAKGDLEVLGVTTTQGNAYRRYATIDGERYATFTYGKRSGPIPETNAPMLGISLGVTETIDAGNELAQRSENLLALRDERFRVLSPAEKALIRQSEATPQEKHCPVSGDETTVNHEEAAVDVGGEIVWLCKDGHVGPFVEDATGNLVAATDTNVPRKAYAGGPGEGAGSFPGIPANWTTGSKRLIAMPIRFPEQASNPFGSTNMNGATAEACNRLNAWSYNRVNFTYTLTNILTLPRTMASYASSGGEDAMIADAINIANNQGYNASGANFRSVYFTGSYGGYCGLGQIVGPHSWVKCIDANTIAHEVGHNLGLPHANAWNITTGNPYGAGTHGEYGGTYNVMGQGPAAFDTMHRFYLRWLTMNETVDVGGPGTYRIYDPEVTGVVGGRKYTLRVPKQGGQFYFVEFRPRANALSGGGSVDGRVQNGIRVLRTDGAHQLDLTPGSGGGHWDGATIVGESTTDAGSGLTLTVNAKGGSGDAQYLDVTVSYQSQGLYTGGVYELQPQCSPGKALEVDNGQDVNGANVRLWESNGSVAQQWKLEQNGGVWELSPLCAPGRRMDVNGSGSANGTNVQIWQDFSNTAQRWTVTNVGNNLVELTPQCAPGSRLDVNGGGNVNGTNVHIWGANGSPAQRWRLIPTAPAHNVVYELEPQCAPGKRMDVSSSQDVNGANVHIWTANSSTAQRWRLEHQGDGKFELIPLCAQSRRLDVNGSGTGNGTNIHIWQDFSNAAQRWSVVGYGSGYFELVPDCATGSRADVSGAGNGDGTNVQLWGSNNGTAQRWRLFRQ